MATQLSNPTVMVNNQQVAIEPNSFKYTEGLGEQKIKAAASGGNEIEQVFSEDVSTNFSMVQFEMSSTPENVELQRAWKIKKNTNFIEVFSRVPGEADFTRSFSQAALLNDVEVNLGSEATISLEFKSNQAV